MANARELRQLRAERLESAAALVEAAEKENRGLTPEETAVYDGHVSEADTIMTRVERLEKLAERQGQASPLNTPTTLKIPRGDDEARALAHYFRTGDSSGVAHLRSEGEGRSRYSVVVNMPSLMELRAVDSTMNITTAADGGATVPTGLGPLIAQRMNERWLAPQLGCTRIPGVGTTVNHVYENADPVVFATKSEQADNLSTNDYERDAMVLAAKAFTLVKKTKKLNLTEELLEDNDVNLMDAIANWISRNMATTHNSMLLTEVAANGTALKTYAAAAAIAAGEPEDIVFNDTLGYYLDDGSSAAWVMRPTTFGNIASLTGSARLYAETPSGSFARSLLGYPVFYSNNAAATAASAKDVYFGDWSQVGYRLANELKLITDPYSEDGVVVLKYSFRTVYGVLIAGGIGYGVHPSA
jgi:HK97 family phage major capsid protein